MKKILLTAIVALIGLSAYAEKPASGAQGYFYNPTAGKFIGTDAKLGSKGQKFEVYYKSSDTSNDPATDYADRGFDGGFYIRFKTADGGKDLCLQSQPIMIGGGYAQFIVRETTKGWLITHPYPNTGNNVPGWVNDNLDTYKGAYLQVVDGALVFAKDTENEGAYWKFVDQEEYEKLTATSEPEPEPEPVAFPETGAKGYIYNPAIDMFIDATGALAKEGAIFAVYRKDSDNKSTDIRFGVPGDEANKHLRINGENPVLQTTDPYYSKWGYEAAEGGLFLLKAGYSYSKDEVEYCTKGYYLTATEDAAFEFVATATDASYWQFITEEEVATRISSVENVATTKAIFNIAGQQIKSLQKGLNIVNGKKIYVK